MSESVTCRNCHNTGHFAKVCRSAPQPDAHQNIRQSNKPTANHPTESKRMRFVRDEAREPEETFDEDDWQMSTPVGKIFYSSMEEGEVCSPPIQSSSLESDSSMDNYQILDVRQAEHERNRRYMIAITAGSVTGEAMIDSGSPVSFLDFTSGIQDRGGQQRRDSRTPQQRTRP